MPTQENINNILTKLTETAQTLKECEASTWEEIKRIDRLKKDKEGLIAQVNEMHKELEHQTQIIETLEANRKKFIQALEAEETAMLNKMQSIKAMAEKWTIPAVPKEPKREKEKEEHEEREVSAEMKRGKKSALEIDFPKNTAADTITTETLADKFQGMHSRSEKSDISTMGIPVSELAKAIGLNDQLLFIKEIFKGDYEVYVQTLEHLNRMDNFEEAHAYLRRVAPHWDPDSEASRLLLSVVRRRYL